MPKFFLHVANSAGFAQDREGADYADLDGARREAVRSIRSILAEELKQGGTVDLRGRVEIADEGGMLIASVEFPSAVRVVEPE